MELELQYKPIHVIHLVHTFLIKKFTIENDKVIIIIGNNTLNDLATAGGTCSGIFISNLLDFDKIAISSPTTNPTNYSYK